MLGSVTAKVPGQVLRAWRGFAGLSAAELARAISVERSMVSMWESGERGRRSAAGLGTVERIAQCFASTAAHFTDQHAKAMVGMWSAAASVEAIPARTVWFHNFPEPPGPVWIWLRSHPGNTDLQVTLEVGPFDQTLVMPDAAGGVIVHAPTSIPNPPLKVTFAEPGWIDCGTGLVAPEVADELGVAMVDTRDIIGRHPPRLPPLDNRSAGELHSALSLIREISKKFQVSWALVAPHIGEPLRPDHPAYALDGESVELAARAGDPVLDTKGAIVSQLMMPPSQTRDVREGRGLSRAAAAERATALDASHPLNDRNLEALECVGRIPAAACALARLDMVYRTDGRLGIDRTFSSRAHTGAVGQFTLEFPEYWQGHVWLQTHGPTPGETCTVELVWGPWRRRQRVRSGGVLTTRKAAPGSSPLNVRLPKHWHLTAGTGAVPTALDINVGWRPTNPAAAWSLVRDTVKSIWDSAPDAVRGSDS